MIRTDENNKTLWSQFRYNRVLNIKKSLVTVTVRFCTFMLTVLHLHLSLASKTTAQEPNLYVRQSNLIIYKKSYFQTEIGHITIQSTKFV